MAYECFVTTTSLTQRGVLSLSLDIYYCHKAYCNDSKLDNRKLIRPYSAETLNRRLGDGRLSIIGDLPDRFNAV